MKEVKIAFVGAGGNACGHMKRLNDVEGVAIVAVSDVDESRANSAAEEYGAKAYPDYHKMLDEVQEVDAVYVSVPPFAHTDAEILAVQKGCHIFVEKPVALSVEKGLEIWEAIKKAGVISCVGYQVRYVDTTQRLKKYLEGKTIGMVSCHRWGGLPGTPWWRVMSESGGQLVEQTTHQVDLMRYFCGDIVEAYAKYALRTMGDVENLDIPDAQAVVMEFESGALGTLSTSCMADRAGKSDLEILMRGQRVGWSANAISSAPEVAELSAPPAETPNIDQTFVAAIRAGDQGMILSDYWDGLKSMDVTLAANKSAQTNKPEKPQLAGK